jgi:hypothetical protein
VSGIHVTWREVGSIYVPDDGAVLGDAVGQKGVLGGGQIEVVDLEQLGAAHVAQEEDAGQAQT